MQCEPLDCALLQELQWLSWQGEAAPMQSVQSTSFRAVSQQLAAAEQCQRENVAIRRRLVETQKRFDLAGALAGALGQHGTVLQALGRLAEAEQCQASTVSRRPHGAKRFAARTGRCTSSICTGR